MKRNFIITLLLTFTMLFVTACGSDNNNKNNNAKELYDSLSYSQKKKYITWITSAKKEETKIKRMNEALLKLEGKVKL